MAQRNTIYQAFNRHTGLVGDGLFDINHLLCFFQQDLLTERHISIISGLPI